MLAGKGVGEHYDGAAWEDRSCVRGPALVQLKTSTRELCLSQGFRADEVPRVSSPDSDSSGLRIPLPDLREQGWTTPVTLSSTHGYGAKPATALKAMCYNLAPEKSCILTFDSLWISDYWAGMVIGAGLRGARVYVVSPGPKNAPSNAAPTLILMRENMRRLFDASRYFKSELSAAGGVLHVGFYNLKTPVYDIRGRIREVLERRMEAPFLTSEFPFDASVIEALRRQDTALPPAPTAEDEEAGGIIPVPAEHPTYIHSKTHLFFTRGVFETVDRPEWAPVLERYLGIRSRQVYGGNTEGIVPDLLDASHDGDAGGGMGAILDSTFAASPRGSAGRPIAWLFVGSQNQDRRGMLGRRSADGGLRRNGLIALPDFMFVLGSATWPSNDEEFDKAYPEMNGPGFVKQLYRYIKDQI